MSVAETPTRQRRSPCKLDFVPDSRRDLLLLRLKYERNILSKFRIIMCASGCIHMSSFVRSELLETTALFDKNVCGQMIQWIIKTEII